MTPKVLKPQNSAEGFFERLDVAGAPRELVALGGRLDTETLIAAYRAGCFPWPPTGPHKESLEDSARQLASSDEVPVLPGTNLEAALVPWLSPDPRPVLLTDRLHIPRSLRRQLRSCTWETTMDVAFDAVVAACAERASTWITAAVREAYTDLHRAGVAHSVEVWAGGELVGGLYGVSTGRVFSGESMFHRQSGASKVAVVDLCSRLVEADVVLIDTEQESEHMEQLGQVAVTREEYLAAVHHLRDDRVELPTERRPASRIVHWAATSESTRSTDGRITRPADDAGRVLR